VPDARETEQGAPILDDGQRVWVTFRDIVLDEAPFVTIGADLERERRGWYARGGLGSRRRGSSGSASPWTTPCRGCGATGRRLDYLEV
jgi:hypothetical protein